MQVQGMRAECAADQAIGLAFVNHHGPDQGVATAHFELGVLFGHAFTLSHAVKGFPILSIAGIELRIHHFEIDAWANAQAKAFNAFFKHRGAADQNRCGQFFIDHHLHRPKHALFLALGIDNASLARTLGRLNNGLHEVARVVHKVLQARNIRIEVLNRPGRHATCHCGFGHCGRNGDDQARIKRLGNQVLGPEGQIARAIGSRHHFALLGPRELGHCMHGGKLHFARDRCST